MSTKTNTTNPSQVNSRILKECRVDDRFKQSKGNTRATESHSQKSNVSSKSCLKQRSLSGVPSQPCKRKSNPGKESCSHPENFDRNSKTWFQVLLESPTKSKPSRILKTNCQKVEIPCRCNDLEGVKENFVPRSENTRRFSLLVDMLYDKIGDTNDKSFLKILNAIRILLDNPNNPLIEGESHPRPVLLTDDDKYNFRKPAKSGNESSRSSDLVLKALLKETKDQRETLQSLNVQILQLREENKMLNQLKDARMNLETKLASRSTETKYLKRELEKLQQSLEVKEKENENLKREQEKMKHLLEMRDKENECLMRRLSILKLAENVKRNPIFDRFADHSFELIANPPSCEISFDMPIRPASSSPAKDIEHENHTLQKNGVNVPEAKELRVCNDTENEGKLKELMEHVNKFTEALEGDMANLNANDVSLNLSDVTYKWSI